MSKNSLSQEIEETDKFIADLSPLGAEFVTRIHALDIKIEPSDEDSVFSAAYNFAARTFHCPTGLTLAERFNLRVHEGAHILQSADVPDMADCVGAREGKVYLRPESYIRFRRAAETNAMAIQTYFNQLAVAKTGDIAFAKVGDDENQLISYSGHLRKLLKRNLPPLETARHMAKDFLGLTKIITIKPFMFSPARHFKVANRDLLDVISLAAYGNGLSEGEIALDNLVTMKSNEVSGLINVLLPLDPDQRITQRLSGPLRLKQENRQDLNRLNLQLA